MEIEMELSKRFTVGQKYAFIRTVFNQGTPRFGSAYFPWMDVLIQNQVVIAECVSVHAVPGDWDDKIQYTGYKFKLVKTNIGASPADREKVVGCPMANQYPRASYGQVSTDSDYYLDFRLEDCTPEQRAHVLSSLRSAERGRDNIAAWGNLKEAGYYFEGLYRGVRTLTKEGDEGKANQLKKHMEEVELLLIQEFGAKVICGPLVLSNKDGATETYKDIIKVDVTFE